MFIKAVWGICVFIIFWAMIGYPISLNLLGVLFQNRRNNSIDAFEPSVTIMVVAHNEEKVILEKLNNLIELDYPADKTSFLVTSDYSTDATNEIVEKFICEHSNRNIRLHKTIEHKGKTNAQNEAWHLVDSEILILTDANAMFEKNAIKELVSSFYDENIVYVCGQLKYVNTSENTTANTEGFYWKLDLKCREIESNIQTITAGNGAIYACRNKYYKMIDPIGCHDSSWPLLYALDKKRSIYNKNAVAYEKAGEIVEDEFKRKVRMNRGILRGILPDIRILNIVKYHWFTFFYLGHRTCRYLLWLMHLLAFVLNIPLIGCGSFWYLTFGLQIVFYFLAFCGWVSNTNCRIIKIIYYYCMTVAAQWCGVINMITGKAKPTWDKAESTR